MKLRLLLLAAVMLTAGCASALLNGQIALRQGRYIEAEGYFNEALAKDPGRTDALVGLGIAQYKAGQVRPNEASVRLYLALGYLKRGETDRAEEQLTALRSLKIDARVGQQVQDALDLIRKGPLSDSVRTFLIGSLETQAELSREVQDARLQAQMAQAYYYSYYPYYPFGPFPPYWGYPGYFGSPFVPYAPCVLVWRGGLPYCI